MWLPDENLWLSVRNVLAVDGHLVPDSKERLDQALATSDSESVSRLRRVQAEGARFDVGQVSRTTGDKRRARDRDDLGASATCTTRYSNFRRFETSGRIVTPR